MSTRVDWGLTVELGGTEYQFATRSVEVDSVQYQSGLAPMTMSRLVELRGSIELEILDRAIDWPERFSAAQWLVEGGRCTIHLIAEEDGSTLRWLWLSGTVGAAKWGPVGHSLNLTMEVAAQEQEIPTTRFRIDPYTAPSTDSGLPSHTGTWMIWTEHQGAHFPLVIGYPGYDDVAEKRWAVVPVPTIQYSDQSFAYDDGPLNVPEVMVYVVGDGRVAAENVWLRESGFSRREEVVTGGDTVTYTYPLDSADEEFKSAVTKIDDALGQRIAIISVNLDTLRGGFTVEDYDGGPAGYVGYSPQSTYGGGVMWQGSVLREGSRIAEWVATQYTDVTLDIGAHRANAKVLDRYLFDTFATDQQPALAWLDELLEFMPAAWVIGDCGVYLAYIPITATDVDVGWVMDAGADEIQWESTDSTDVDGVQNEISFRWAQQRDQGSYLNTRTLTSEYEQVITVPGGALYKDDRAVGNAICRVSQRRFQARPHTLDIPVVWNQATAFRIANDYALRKAFPTRTFTYSMDNRLYRMRPGEVVRLTDGEQSITDRLMTVVDVRIGGARLSVDLRPVRTPNDYL